MGDNNSIKVTWYGHSCFLLECSGCKLVLDPYSPGSVPGYDALDLSANQVISSHGHRDHCWDGIKIEKSEAESPFSITEIETFHDDKQGSLRGTNIIHIVEGNGVRVAHLGDIGCDLSDEQVKRIGKLDCILIPVGGYYTINAKQAEALLERLEAAVVVPMHYRYGNIGLSEISVLDDFKALRDDVKIYDSNTITITNDMDKQTAVLTYA